MPDTRKMAMGFIASTVGGVPGYILKFRQGELRTLYEGDETIERTEVDIWTPIQTVFVPAGVGVNTDITLHFDRSGKLNQVTHTGGGADFAPDANATQRPFNGTLRLQRLGGAGTILLLHFKHGYQFGALRFIR